jgi:ADP-heptose:LPS heptosyltransferase
MAPPATAERILDLPEASRREAASVLTGARAPRVAVHVAGGRPVKQWDPDRFADVAARLIDSRGVSIVLTGAPGDRPLIDRVKAGLPRAHVVDASAVSGLLAVGAILEQCDVMITGDTGPMHLAAAAGTPVVGLYGPTNPARNGPWSPEDVTVSRYEACRCHHKRRCSAPAWCLDSIGVDEVVGAVERRLKP